MKKIIGNKLYDTKKAKKVYSYREKRKTGAWQSINFYNWYDVDIYKTDKGNYFICGYSRESTWNKDFIEEITEEKVKEIIKELSADTYIELFGEIEEA